MALNMTQEEKIAGQANFNAAAEELTRRDFMKSLALTGGVIVPVSAALYFNYKSNGLDDKPVKAAIIGAGDEGGVLLGEHNPKYLEIVAVCDIRPTNMTRIFEGETVEVDGEKKPKPPRVGLQVKYPDTFAKINKYDNYKEMLRKEGDNIEAVIIALPLHLHASATIDCLNAGKHVLCEKLMAWNVTQCKEMIRAAEKTAEKKNLVLSIGHQRHYSMLYAHAQEAMASGMLGEVRHIRALWHRDNVKPKIDPKTKKPIPKTINDSWKKDIPKADNDALASKIKQLGYKSMEELCHWRLYKRTGGGLMAELGSHQLDACSIFLGKVKPLAVTAVGGTYFYRDGREVEDHVFCTFEFPGRNFWKDGKEPPVNVYDVKDRIKDKDDRVVVTYSSINTNQFEPYGECVMGSRGTMVVEGEQSIQLYGTGGRLTSVSVEAGASGRAALSSGGSEIPGGKPSTSGAAGVVGGGWGAVSRGYREEIEHFAYCVRMAKEGMSTDRPRVRCDGPAAMVDAIMALVANRAMEKQERIEFTTVEARKWFDWENDGVPDKDKVAEIVTG